MMKNITFLQLSNERLRYLSKLKQKKYRLQEGLVIVEGKRTLDENIKLIPKIKDKNKRLFMETYYYARYINITR